jgi:hypothetical protein
MTAFGTAGERGQRLPPDGRRRFGRGGKLLLLTFSEFYNEPEGLVHISAAIVCHRICLPGGRMAKKGIRAKT